MRIPLFDFEPHRIIMESYFAFNGEDYIFFPEGVVYYSLYRSTRKINSFAELCYVAEKFIYLNPEFDIDKMKRLFVGLSDRESGHIVRTYSENRVNEMVERVAGERVMPFCPRLRKIIFNPSKPLTREQKRVIVAKLIHAKEKPTPNEIDGVIEELWLDKQKITIRRVADELNTTHYLVRWYFDKKTLQVIRGMNREIRKENQIAKAIGVIDELTEGGNKLKMRKLKEITSIRNYAFLKEAVIRYQKTF
jgi:hypothetical protein